MALDAIRGKHRLGITNALENILVHFAIAGCAAAGAARDIHDHIAGCGAGSGVEADGAALQVKRAMHGVQVHP